MRFPRISLFAAALGASAALAGAPAFAAEDTFDVDPDLELTCVWGIVSYDYSGMVFSSAEDGSLEVDGLGSHSGILQPLAMTGTMEEDGSFEVSQSVLGGCNEYYTLTGQFDEIGDWTGTFSRDFVPSYGGACYDCTSADIEVTGTCLDSDCELGVVQDSDGDGVNDDEDACPGYDDTLDGDEDGVPDDCDACEGVGSTSADDIDADGICDSGDNCPADSNPTQEDADGDGIGDACEVDSDLDGTIDDDDNCPDDFNADQADSDGDGEGDACDLDDDDDGVEDDDDNCSLVYNPEQDDYDGDGQGDECDGDDDADGISDEDDLCATTPLDVAIDADGCSGAQQVELVVGEPSDYSNHGQYVKAVVSAAQDAVDAGLLSKQEKAAIVREAARSDVGK